ncbi:MAG: IS21 family transposase, partial [Desulfosarcinaceae bacterium]
MIDYEMFCKIKQYQQNGLTPGQIAEQLALDYRTVQKWLEQERFCQRKKADRKSKLDPYKELISRLLNNHSYSAIQIFQQLKEQGFTGGYTIVKDYVRRVRPVRKPAFLKLSFAPGECAQVDWGSYGSVKVGSTYRRLSFFVMVLCYSRLMYLEFTLSQSMEHWLACHQNAFRFFGFLVEKIMVDNLKSAVLKRNIGQAPVFNAKYLDVARHYGFTIVPCGVGKG